MAASTIRKKKAANKTAAPKRKKKAAPRKISHHTKPDGMTAEAWQRQLRVQIAAESRFSVVNIGEEAVFSDYQVHNPQSGNTYKVAIRSAGHAFNFCSCYDFKTNLLGTCKHIEAVLRKITRKPGTRKLLQQHYQPAYTSMYVTYAGERKVMIRIGSDNEKEFKRLFAAHCNATMELRQESFEQIDLLLKKAARINPSFRCYEDALQMIIDGRERAHRQQWLQPYTRKKKLPAIKNLKITPFAYQAEGVLFSATAGRGILADDMGLGKTLQAIATVELLCQSQYLEKVLIVCPTSLKYQWKSEIEKFTKKNTVTIVEGGLLARKRIYAETQSRYIIITYNVVSYDQEYLNTLLRPDMVILDEAQRIKNWKTKISANVKKLQSKYALILTGTPLENNLEELYSLVQFVNPLLLGSLHNFLGRHQVKEGGSGKVIGYERLDEIAAAIKPVLLRRTKKQVLQQLPQRTDTNRFVTITKEQWQVHEERKEAVAKLVLKWQRQHFLSEEDRQRLLINLNLMRMVCDSTFIFDQRTNHQTKVDEVMSLLDEILNIADEKVVIFSQWEKMTRLISKELEAAGIGFEYLHGGVAAPKREGLYQRFNTNPETRVFLSTDAGGVGLNLQTASHLINVDIPWNPAVLEQRVGRIYRYGQKKNVNIINLVAQGTIEHGMLSRLKFKSALAEGILDNGESSIFMSESRFNQFMNMVQDVSKEIQPAAVAEEETVFEEKQTAQPKAETAFEDDDVKELNTTTAASKNAAQTNTLLQTGVSFMSQLGAVLNDKAATAHLLSIITQKDETGKTYLKIEVENEQVISNMIQALAGLFKGNG
jgi:SNF2 family DNA or RNA helicase